MSTSYTKEVPKCHQVVKKRNTIDISPVLRNVSPARLAIFNPETSVSTHGTRKRRAGFKMFLTHK